DIQVGADVGIHDASRFVVLPGGVDVHTHLDWDFGTARTVDTFGTGTRAAAFGGTTTLVDFANQTRGQGLRAGLDDCHRRAESSCVDVAAPMIVLAVTRPSLMEGEATHRAIRLAELAQTPHYIVHLSAAEALAAITEARDRGLPAHAVTCPHYLFLTDEAYDRPGFEGAKYVMTPPLRTRAHQEALWR